MSIEGQLRELAPGEVLQLLSLSRRTGTLRFRSQLDAREACVVIDAGFIVDASRSNAIHAHSGDDDSTSLFERALHLLSWKEGEFRFSAHPVGQSHMSDRIPIDSVLMEGAHRSASVAAIEGIFDGPHVVPSFSDIEPKQLPLLHLAPDEWEILTRVDGVRSLADLADGLGKELVDVANTVHGLIGSGVLTIASSRDTVPEPVAQEFPVVIPPVYSPDMPFVLPYDQSEEDTLFDPMQVGVMTPDGMPATSEAAVLTNAVTSAGEPVTPSAQDTHVIVTTADTSRHTVSVGHWAKLLRDGDGAARGGDFHRACELWQRWLDESAASSHEEVDAVRQRIRLARQLSSLLHS